MNTSVAISCWIFSNIEPTSPRNGMMWFQTSISSIAEFNALKENNLQIYPAFTKQYVDNSWVNIVSKIYQNSSWIDFVTYIYNNGIEIYELTLVKAYSDVLYVKNSDNITVTIPSTSVSNRVNGVKFQINSKIDFSRYSTMKVISSSSNIGASLVMALGYSASYGGETGSIVHKYGKWNSINNDEIISIDVSSVNEEAYPIIYPLHMGNTAPATITIRKWWLE